jgi:hypothetical protein
VKALKAVPTFRPAPFRLLSVIRSP